MGALFTGSNADDSMFVIPIMVGDNYMWNGRNATKINSNIYTFNTTLDDTDFSTWTASSTATNMITSTTVDTTISADLEKYDYIIEWFFDINVAHSSTKKAMPVRTCGYIYQVVHQSIYGLASTNITEINGPNYNVADNLMSNWLYEYTSSATAKTIRRNISYGFYPPAAPAPTLSATTGNDITITLNTPIINMRAGNSTYFTNANYEFINQSASTVKIRGNVYKVDKSTSFPGNVVNNLISLYNNPL